MQPAPPAPALAALSLDDMRARIRSKSRLKGRQSEAAAMAEVAQLLGPRPEQGFRRDLLIEYLHRLNDHFGWLGERHLVALARQMNLPMAEVYEVASFYHHFEIVRGAEDEAGEPGAAAAPRLLLRVCESLSCSLAGAQALLDGLPDRLRAAGLGHVQLLAAPCMGRCEQAPVAMLHQLPLPHATLDSVLQALQTRPSRALAQHPPASLASGFDPAALAGSSLPAPLDAVSPAYVDLALYRARGGYQLAAALCQGEIAPEALLGALDDSGLRGLGGAGFPAGRKWRIVRDQSAPRLMAVNIDEGEPGTFKDRSYLERDPHRFLEGLLIAAELVGCEAVYIYLRDEYHGCRALLQSALEQLRAEPPCVLPRIELRRGAGAYICGEESAMIESIEGKRGEPRLRPPYIAQRGLFGRPTLEHNFETLYWVRDIVEKGAQWFTSFGRHGRKGLRSFSVSGRVRQPGVKLAPAGITAQELIDEYCGGMPDGHRLYAYLPGGASGGILPASLNQIPLDFDTLQPYGCFIGSAALIVLSQHDRARDAALNLMRFFAHESCGQCTPCRVGTAKAAALMQSPQWDGETLEDLAQVMADASICGLGQAAPNPIRCMRRYFPQEVGLDPWPGEPPS